MHQSRTFVLSGDMLYRLEFRLFVLNCFLEFGKLVLLKMTTERLFTATGPTFILHMKYVVSDTQSTLTVCPCSKGRVYLQLAMA